MADNEIYTVISGSNEITRFEFVNKLLVGDKKIVYVESGSSNVQTKEITSLDIVYKDNFYIYNVDIEPYDYFLVDSKNDDGLFSIHHNPCNYCYTTWAPCGNYWCDWSVQLVLVVCVEAELKKLSYQMEVN